MCSALANTHVSQPLQGKFACRAYSRGEFQAPQGVYGTHGTGREFPRRQPEFAGRVPAMPQQLERGVTRFSRHAAVANAHARAAGKKGPRCDSRGARRRTPEAVHGRRLQRMAVDRISNTGTILNDWDPSRSPATLRPQRFGGATGETSRTRSRPQVDIGQQRAHGREERINDCDSRRRQRLTAGLACRGCLIRRAGDLSVLIPPRAAGGWAPTSAY